MGTLSTRLALGMVLAASSAMAAPARLIGEEIIQHKPLSPQEIRVLIKPGTKVHHRTAAGGNVRTWTIRDDWTFIATDTETEALGGRPYPLKTGYGKSAINQNGEYCVNIGWHEKGGESGTEKWCRAVFPINGINYMAPLIPSPGAMKAPYGTAEFD